MTNSNFSGKRPGEFELIAQLFAPLAKAPGALGLKDDAALIAVSEGNELVVTTDAVIEGVHFLPNDPPGTVGRKALRVNLSDLAAKGCTPLGYLLVLSIPDRIGMNWLSEFAHGLAGDQQEFGVSLIGGDTAATPGPATIAITAFGELPSGSMLRRSGAKTGDLVYVSGTIGDAGGGLECLKGGGRALQAKDRDFLIRRYRLPEPRIKLGQALRTLATSSIDVSDGLLADLGHIGDASGARLVVEAARLPISSSLAALWMSNATERAAIYGDDYEIAFTAPPATQNALERAAVEAKVSIAQIGYVEAGTGVSLVDRSGNEIRVSRKGYTHF